MTSLLLKAAFHPDLETARESWRVWQEECDFDSAFWSDLRIASLAHRRLSGMIDAGLLEPRLQGLRRYVWSVGQVRIDSGLALLRKFVDSGLRFMLIKGSVRLARDQKAIVDRFINDLDVLISAEDWQKAVDVGFQEGWAPEEKVSRDMAVHRMRQTHHSLNMKKGRHGAVDLHQFSLLLNRQPGADSGLWQRAVHASLGGVKVLLPHPSDHLAIVFGHGFVYAPYRSFDWVADALATIALPHFDWRLFTDVVIGRELAVPTAAALTYLSEELGRPVDNLRRIASYVREPFITEMAASHRVYNTHMPSDSAAIRQAECVRALRLAPRSGTTGKAITKERSSHVSRTCLKLGDRVVLPMPSRIRPELRVQIRLTLAVNNLAEGQRAVVVLRSPDIIPVEIGRWRLRSDCRRTIELPVDGALIWGRAMDELVLLTVPLSKGSSEANIDLSFNARVVRNPRPLPVRYLVWTGPTLSKICLAFTPLRRLKSDCLALPDHLALPDQKWVEAAEFLRSESRQSDVTVAPEEFRYLCNALVGEILPEDISKALKPDAVVVLHKGRLGWQPPAALVAIASTIPIFANEVFVVFSKTGRHLAAEMSVHVGPVRELIEGSVRASHKAQHQGKVVHAEQS